VGKGTGLGLAIVFSAARAHGGGVELDPAYLPAVPRDVMNGRPYGYRLDGSAFRLWSVGWNGVDEGGASVENKPNQPYSQEKGDWVWFGFRPAAAPPGK